MPEAAIIAADLLVMALERIRIVSVPGVTAAAKKAAANKM
jgi:hypothetical protein